MIPLQYDISAVGADRLRRVFRSIETEAKAHVRRFEATTGARTGATGRTRQDNRAIKGLADIGRVARREEDRRLRHAIRNREREERRAIRGIAEIGRVARREQDRQHRHAIRQTERERVARQRAAQRAASGAVSVMGGGIRSAGRFVAGAAGAAGLVGTFAAQNAVREEIDIVARASRLANQAGRPEIKGQLAAESRNVRGFTGSDVLGGLEAFVDITGDLGAARAAMGDLSKLALATGTNLNELAAAAGNAFIPLKDQIRDPEKRLQALRDTMATIAAQGAVGAVEIKDLATEMAGLAATANRFVGNRQEILGVMGAMAQAARQRGGADSAAEAVTSVARFSSDLIKKQKALGNMGVNIFADEGRTQLKDPRQIMADVLRATKGDLGKLTGIFGERSIRAVAGFAPVFTQAERRRRGTGLGAVEKEFTRLTGGQLTGDEIERRFRSRMEDPDIALREQMKDFNQTLANELLPIVTERLLPAFKDLAPHIATGVEALADFVDFVADNPLKGIGAIIAGKIALDLAGAGIGAVVERGLSSIFSRVRMPGGAGGAAPVAGGGRGGRGGRLVGAVGLAGTALALGAMAFEEGKALGGEASAKSADPRMRAINTMRELDTGSLSGVGLIRRKAALQRDLGKLKEGPGMAETFFGGVSSLMGGPSASEANEQAQQSVQQALNEIDERLGGGEIAAFGEHVGRGAQEAEMFTASLSKARQELDQMRAPSRDARRNDPIIRRGGS